MGSCWSRPKRASGSWMGGGWWPPGTLAAEAGGEQPGDALSGLEEPRYAMPVRSLLRPVLWAASVGQVGAPRASPSVRNGLRVERSGRAGIVGDPRKQQRPCCQPSIAVTFATVVRSGLVQASRRSQVGHLSLRMGAQNDDSASVDLREGQQCRAVRRAPTRTRRQIF